MLLSGVVRNRKLALTNVQAQRDNQQRQRLLTTSKEGEDSKFDDDNDPTQVCCGCLGLCAVYMCHNKSLTLTKSLITT